MQSEKRLPALDLLRFAAIFSTIATHSEIMSASQYGDIIGTISYIARCGSIFGVPLFFVLSGFLVSGLLFAEYKKTDNLNVKRFLIRRGLKIYPAFYFLIFSTLIFQLIYGSEILYENYLAEIFFVQNYFPGVYYHTWSLAVEEHFYLTLPLLLIILLRINRTSPEPFRLLKPIAVCLFIWSIIFDQIYFQIPGADYAPYLAETYTTYTNYIATHARIEALFLGMLVSYYYHFEREKLQVVWKHPVIWLTVAAALLFPMIFNLVQVPGLSIYRAADISFVTVLIVSVNSIKLTNFAESRLGRFLTFLGQHSYSIYLWHMAVFYTLRYFFENEIKNGQTLCFNLIFGVASFVVGIAFSKLIEIPVLKLRDKYFPKDAQTR